jgi:hypothetical protein
VAKKKQTKSSKADAGAKGGSSKKSKIPRPVQGRGFATFGLLALAFIAWMLLQGSLDLEAAARRAVIVLVGLMLIERIVAPLIMAVVNSGPGPADTEEKPAPDAA